MMRQLMRADTAAKEFDRLPEHFAEFDRLGLRRLFARGKFGRQHFAANEDGAEKLSNAVV